MKSYNIVRFKIRPGKDRSFLDAHGPGKINWPGLKSGTIIKIGEGDYCLIGEWQDAEALSSARPHMLATLDTFRQFLLPVAGGVTEAYSGAAVLAIT